MASTEAAINVIINGQERVNKLISSFEKFDNLVAAVNKTPINLSIGNVERQITSLEKSTASALQKAAALREQAEKKNASASERLVRSIANSAKAIQELEEKGAQSTKKYSDAVASRDSAIQKLSESQRKYAESLEEVEAIEGRANSTRTAGLARLEKNKKNIEAVNNLVDDYIVKARRAERQQIMVPAKISSQIQLFKQLADNVDATGENFRKFTLAGVTAEIDAAQVSIRKYQILADSLGSREGKKPSFPGIGAQDFTGPRQAVQELVQSFPKIAKSEAGLNSYREQLLSVQRLVTSTSPEFVQLAGAVRAVDQEIATLSARDLSRVDRSLAPKGPSVDLVTQQLQERAKTENRIEKQSDRLFKLSEKIEDKIVSQAEKTRLLTDANKVLNVLAESRVEDAAKQITLIEREVRAAERLQRAKRTPTNATFGALGTEFMPVSGRGPSGIAPGSPADRQRSMRAKLTWQTALSQMADIAISNLSAGTQDAVALVQRRSAEIERSTARMWREFGGPALPPRLARSAGGAAMPSQPFRAGGPGAATSVLTAPRRVESQIRSAENLTESLIGLEIKGIDVSQQKNSLQRVLNELKASDLQISDQILTNYDAELNKIRDIISIENKRIANARALQRQEELGGAGGAELRGFGKSFQTFSANLKDSSEFLGGLSPEQGIDKIVREFNKSVAGGRKQSGGAGKNVVDTLLGETKSGIPKAAKAGLDLGKAVEDGLDDGLDIASPSGVAERAMRNVIQTLVSVAKSGRASVQSAIEGLISPDLGDVSRINPSSIPGPGGQLGDVATKIGAFVARTSANPSFSRKLVSLAGENILSSPAVTEATYRKAYERGGITPPMYLPTSARRGLRGTPGIPGAGLESALFSTAVRTASETGAFVGPLGLPQRRAADLSTMSSPEIGRTTGLPSASVAAPTGIFESQAKQAQIATAGLYSMIGEKTFKDFSARAAEVTAASVPTALDNVKQSLSILGTDLSSKSKSLLAKGKESGRKIVEFADDVSSLGRTFASGTGAGEAVSRALQSARQITVPGSRRDKEGRDALFVEMEDLRGGASSSPTPTLATPLHTVASIQAEINELQGKTSGAIKDAGIEGSRRLRDRLKDGLGSFGDRVLGGLSGASGGGSGGGGRGAGAGDFSGRFRRAREQGPEALLTLDELANPAQASTKSLTELIQVLNEFRVNLDRTKPGFKKVDKQLRVASARTAREVQRRDPQAELLTRAFGVRGGRAVGEGVVGAAFPLLFGQGAGSSIFAGLGGAAGGFAGGGLGLGLSLVGTSIGTFIDELGRKSIELGNALNEPAKAFDLVKERSLFSSRELEKSAQKMQDAGYEVAASIMAQQEIFKKVGSSGVENLQALDNASDELSRSLASASIRMQAFVAGPLADLLSSFSRALGSGAETDRYAKLLEELPADKAQGLRDKTLEAVREANMLNPLRFRSSVFGTQNAEPDEGEVGRLSAVGGLSPVLEEFEKFVLNAEVNIDKNQVKKEAQDALQGISSVLSQQLELIDIGKNLSNQYRNAAREQEDLARQRQDIEKSYLESIGDIRLGIERAVQKEALDGIRTQNELLKIQGETRLQQFRNATAELVSAQGADEYGRRLFEILGRAGEIELSTQQEIENKKRDLELDLQSKAIETEIYKGDIAKQIARLNESTAKSVADINRSVRRANEDYDERRFGIEKEIARSRLAIIKSETEQSLLNAREAEARYRTAVESGKLPQAQAESLLTATGNLRVYISALEGQQKMLDAAAKQVAGAQPPPRRAEVAAVSTSGVSFAAYDAIRERALAAAKAIAEANEGLVQLARQGSWQKVKEELLDLADQGFARASSELNVFVQRYEEFAAGRIGDEFSAPLEQLEQKIKDFEAFKRLEATENTSKMMEAFVGAGMNREQIEFFVELGLQTTKLSEAQLQGVRTTGFYTDSISSLSQEVESLSAELLKATEFGSEYEKAMASLVRRGLDPAAEASKAFLAEAEKLDILKQKIAIVEGFTFASDTLSGSLKDLIKQFAELGSASEAVKKVSENIAKTSMDFVLDLAFKPVEESMRKTMLDMATKLGFDISTPQERQLQNLIDINNTTASIKDIIEKLVSDILAVQSLAAPSPANQIVPGRPGSLATPGWTGAGAQYQGSPASQQIDPIGPQSSLPGVFTGMGGSNDQSYEILKTKADQLFLNFAFETYEKVEAALGESVQKIQTVPELEAYQKTQLGIVGKFLENIPLEKKPAMASDITNIIETAVAKRMSQINPGLVATAPATEINKELAQAPIDASNQIAKTVQEDNRKLAGIVPQWGKNLGQVVTGLSLASSAVIGIVGGFQNIKKGGAGNVLTGIGSILTTIGGIGMSAAGFMKPGIPGNPTAAGGNLAAGIARAIGNANGNAFEDGELMKFANGGILQSPTLFNFEDAGVSRTGQAGEAGPEAIMPLKRTKDGRLGVEADLSIPFEGGSLIADEEPAVGSLDPASVPFQREGGGAVSSASMPFQGEGGRNAQQRLGVPFERSAGAMQQPLTVPFMKGDGAIGSAELAPSADTIKFESMVINSVEYVTRTEAEQIGRASAARGADLAQRRIKNNPQIRRSIGV